MMLSLDADCDAAAVRSRSTLLFHTILLLSTSYSVPFPSQLHVTLTNFVNTILAPQILSPQPHELNTDFLRAIDLLKFVLGDRFKIAFALTDALDTVSTSPCNWLVDGQRAARTPTRCGCQRSTDWRAGCYRASLRTRQNDSTLPAS